MRIAICISGHLRTFEKTFAMTYNNFFKYHDCDFFIHTWNKLGYDRSKNDCDKSIKNIDTNSKINSIYNTYDPKLLEIVEYNPSMFIGMGEQFNIGFNPAENLSMFYSIKRSYELKEEYENKFNIKYDYTIRYRSDMIIYQDLNFKTDFISLPEIGAFHSDGINDMLAFGQDNLMEKYFKNFDKLITYCNDYKIRYAPEVLTKFNLDINNIKYKTVPINLNIYRADGSYLF